MNAIAIKSLASAYRRDKKLAILLDFLIPSEMKVFKAK